MFWKLDRVKEVLVAKDGETRGVVLKVAGRGKGAMLLQRPIQLLYPIEVPCLRQKVRLEDGNRALD